MALLIGLHERGVRPDVITFADTGGEKPETYAYIAILNAWLKSVGFPELVVVQNDGLHKTLEQNCLTKKMLPDIAYGRRKGCSDKYKQRPQHKYLRRQFRMTMDWWARKEKATGNRPLVEKLIGYGSDETGRAKVWEDSWYLYRYPLIEWEWDRQECMNAIERTGLPMPPKSACFFCPSSKKIEVLKLANEHPDLFERACAMERNADLHTVKGLGRRYAWQDLVVVDPSEAWLGHDDALPECVCIGEVPENDEEEE